MHNIYTIFVKYLHNICTIFAQFLHNICTRYDKGSLKVNVEECQGMTICLRDWQWVSRNVKGWQVMKKDVKKLLGNSPSQLSMHKFVLVYWADTIL